jgi:arginyl-tRNA synthetase
LYLAIQQNVREKIVQAVRETFGREIGTPVLGFPPTLEMGELSIASCFELAKQLRRPPRKIAEQLAPLLLPIAGVERVAVAGGGYLNFYLDRAAMASALFRLRSSRPETPVAEHVPGVPKTEPTPLGALPDQGKAKFLVEHTSINPNKAAHIGHLRNTVLGDTFVRLCRSTGRLVEVQNYIDNTGVQVADVVVGFTHLEKKGLLDVEKLIATPSVRFDYYCWDLYARVFQFYEKNKEAVALRQEALKAIEEGGGEMAAIADLVSTAVVRKHIETMQRLNVRYDLLVQESEILRLDFWKHAFEVLKKNGAVRYQDSGKNAGCWVMILGQAVAGDTDQEPESEDAKIIVRSNGTVTYVGKDIAYHLWKFALLGKDFGYQPFFQYPNGHRVWRTALTAGPGAPAFGHASVAYSVIDTRQSYLQNVVAAAFRALGFDQQAANLHHFSYEVVGLTPGCAKEMGVEISEEDSRRSYVEVSGRKGLGVKADDLIDTLVAKATEEVEARHITEDSKDRAGFAHMIAVAALRYFLLKFSRRMIIAFDFKEALAFEGETGPYLQYSVVRARNILRKFREAHPDFDPAGLGDRLPENRLKPSLTDVDGEAFWELIFLSAQLEMFVEQAIATTEPSVVAKYAFRLAQAFNNFYHRYHILNETDATRQYFLLYIVYVASETLSRTLDLMGMEAPDRM